MLLNSREIEQVLQLWPAMAGASAALVNHSENHTFRVDLAEQRCFSLRIHRPGYQTFGSIQSELAWIEALRRDRSLPVPEPVPGTNGQLLQEVPSADGTYFFAVLFRHIPGAEPSPEGELDGLFKTLGWYAAELHLHATQWRRPPLFERQVWRAQTILDADGLWGDWRTAPGVTAELRLHLNQIDSVLRDRLADYGTGADRYGLIHADMRLANLLVHPSRVSLIDFDDCGYCWFIYDLAASLSFIEMRSDLEELIEAWCAGYSSVRSLTSEDRRMIAPMILLRRMALLAWIGSHGETTLAQHHAPGFAEDTVALAERLLRFGPKVRTAPLMCS